MKRLLAFAASAALASLAGGCHPSEEGEEPTGTAEEAGTVCAAGATVKGIDVSVWQGNIDWAKVKGAGIDFAIARISDGLNSPDSKFDQNWSGMKANGIVRGAYQFFEPGQDPIAQADMVIAKLGVIPAGDLPATLDVEVTGGQSAATIATKIKQWADHVTVGTGKAPMIYTSPGFWNGSVATTQFGYLPLWAAHWGVSCPNLSSGWSDWKVWQYADNGTVNGISGAVDLDEFNGDLAALHTFAGQSADWGAKYVDQSWPFATTTMNMTVNQVVDASLTLKNTGGKSWDASTKLGTTQPRDRSSDFAGADWLAPNRPAGVSGTVAPGQDFKFTFKWHAPNKPGLYDEFFGVLEEGVSWFSDAGQLGPPDDQIEAKIQVDEAAYHGEFVQQSFPTLQEAPVEMTTGQTLSGYIELKNVGTATWKAGETKLAPTPRDMGSPQGASTWISATRVSTLEADVPPGMIGHFALDLTADQPGDYTQTFTLLEEAVTWFADAPKGGGPADDSLAVHVVVSAKPDAGAGGSGGTSTGTGTHTGTGGGGDNGEVEGKCGCRVAGEEGGRGSAWLVALGGALWVARRRRR
jgi:lysozyme